MRIQNEHVLISADIFFKKNLSRVTASIIKKFDCGSSGTFRAFISAMNQSWGSSVGTRSVGLFFKCRGDVSWKYYRYISVLFFRIQSKHVINKRAIRSGLDPGAYLWHTLVHNSKFGRGMDCVLILNVTRKRYFEKMFKKIVGVNEIVIVYDFLNRHNIYVQSSISQLESILLSRNVYQFRHWTF